MKKLFILSILMFLLSVSSTAQVEVIRSNEIRTINGKEYYIHLVQPGQTLYSISKAYLVPIDEIRYENPELRDGLKALQPIKIPVKSRDVEVVEKIREGKFDFIYHIARRGQSFADIALIYSVPEEMIRSANPDIIQSPREGQYVRVPALDTGDEALIDENLTMHKVEPGETFYSISKQYNLSVEALREANEGMAYPKAGDMILIPVVPVEQQVKKAPSYIEYKVKPGETLYGVAKKFQTPIDSIRSYNFGLVDNVNAGQVLRIPYRPDEKEFIVHRVDERKISMRKLAKKYEVEVDELRNLNPRLDNRISYNQSVRIPVEEDAYVPVLLEPEETEPATVEIEPEARPDPCMARMAKDETYKVALMIPLYLEEVEHGGDRVLEDPETASSFLPFQFIQFYQGFMLAADSLAGQGLKVEVHVYDVDQQISKTIKVLQEEELKEMDLIVGPFFRNSFKYVANFAGLFDIKIVNPLSRSGEVLADSRNVFKIMPAESVQPYILKRLVAEKFKNHRVVVVRHNNFQFSEAAASVSDLVKEAQAPWYSLNNELLMNEIEDLSAHSLGDKDADPLVEVTIEGKRVFTDVVKASPTAYTEFPNDVPVIVYTDDSLRGIERSLSVIRPNLVVALADNEVFVIELMTSLNELKDSLDITLAGLPEWGGFGNLDPEYLMNFHTHLMSAEYVDYERSDVSNFVAGFRLQYEAEPAGYAFDGYDIGMYFLSALMSFGSSFEECLEYARPALLQGKYRFMDVPGGGFENRYWNVYKYGDYEIEEIFIPGDPDPGVERL